MIDSGRKSVVDSRRARHAADLRGTSRVAVDTVLGITGLVEHLHRTIQETPGPVGAAAQADRTRGITGFVYQSVRRTTRLVGAGIDKAIGPLSGFLPDSEPSPRRDALVSALNGLYGDYLARSGNPLAIDMIFRHAGETLDLNDPAALRTALAGAGSGRVLLLVHGLCLNERHWLRDGHDHGAALAAELGCVPVYLRYNTGLSIAANGQLLADRLDLLVNALGGSAPEITILGHSMGGLVARSAFHHAGRGQHRWLSQVRRCVFLGTPHLGAPLERAGHGLDWIMELSPYIAPFTRLGKSRSAGIKDLRHGNITRGAKRAVPLPTTCASYAIAATLGARRGAAKDRLLGDGLVPVDSALGRSRDPVLRLAIPASHRWVAHETGHLQLLGSPAVYERLRGWLG